MSSNGPAYGIDDDYEVYEDEYGEVDEGSDEDEDEEEFEEDEDEDGDDDDFELYSTDDDD